MKVLNNGNEISKVQTVRVILNAFEIMLIIGRFEVIASKLRQIEQNDDARILTNFANKLLTKDVTSSMSDAESELFGEAVIYDTKSDERTVEMGG